MYRVAIVSVFVLIRFSAGEDDGFGGVLRKRDKKEDAEDDGATVKGKKGKKGKSAKVVNQVRFASLLPSPARQHRAAGIQFSVVHVFPVRWCTISSSELCRCSSWQRLGQRGMAHFLACMRSVVPPNLLPL